MFVGQLGRRQIGLYRVCGLLCLEICFARVRTYKGYSLVGRLGVRVGNRWMCKSKSYEKGLRGGSLEWLVKSCCLVS